MSYVITSEVTRIDGRTAETILCKDEEINKIMFLQDFQSRLATELDFIDMVDACFYLDKYYAPSKHFVASGEIYSQSPEGEKELCFFGKLEEC